MYRTNKSSQSEQNVEYNNHMGFEGKISPDAPRGQRFCLREMPLDVSNRFQAELAAIEYAKYHGDEASTVPSSTAMLWWITKGFARAYGDYVVAHEDDEIDVADELDREDVLKELEKSVTIH